MQDFAAELARLKSRLHQYGKKTSNKARTHIATSFAKDIWKPWKQKLNSLGAHANTNPLFKKMCVFGCYYIMHRSLFL
jgi:hypothetical protein